MIFKKTKARRNPELLTLVNPGKPPKKKRASKGGSKVAAKKKGKKKAAAKKRKTAKPKQSKAVKAARKSAQKARTQAKKASKKVASLKKQLTQAKKATKKARKSASKKKPARARVSRPKATSTKKPRAKIGKKTAARVTGKKGKGKRPQGWWPRKGSKDTWAWYENKGKKRKKAKAKSKRKSGRKQTAAQRRASLRNLKKARASRRNPRRKSSKKRKSTKRRRVYKRNPLTKVKAIAKKLVKPLVGGAGGFFLSRFVGNHVAMMESVPMSVRPYAPLAANIGTAIALPFVVKKIKVLSFLKPYVESAVVGALVAGAETAMAQWGPLSLQAYVAPPVGLAGLGDVYERALRGGGSYGLNEGWSDYLPGDEDLLMELEDEDMGEYIEEPLGLGTEVEALDEYIEEPLSEYIEEPLGEYIEEPLGGLGLEVEEAVAGFGMDELDVVALDGGSFDIEEAVAGDTEIFSSEKGNGIFGDLTPGTKNSGVTPAKVAATVDACVAHAARQGFMPSPTTVYRAVKAATGSGGSSSLRRMTAAALKAASGPVPQPAARIPAGLRNDPMQGAPMLVQPIPPAAAPKGFTPATAAYGPGRVNYGDTEGGIFEEDMF